MAHLVVRGGGGSGLPIERVASFTHCHPTIKIEWRADARAQENDKGIYDGSTSIDINSQSQMLFRAVMIFKSGWNMYLFHYLNEKVREKSRDCHNHKPQPFPDTKRKRKPTNPNKHISKKRTKSNKISSLFPKRGNRNAKRTKNTRTKWHKLRHKTNRLVK